MKNNHMLSYLLTICMTLSSMAFAIGGGGGGGSSLFNIDASYSDVFTNDATGCRNVTNLRWNLSARAATVANRPARYIGADVQLWADGIFRASPAKGVTESNGPKSAINTPTVTVSLTCALLLRNGGNLDTEAKGWHKAIAQSNDPKPGSGRNGIVINTSDRIRI